MFYGAQKSLPSTTSRDDCHGTCETLRSAERQGPTDSEPVELANSTTPLILYRLQKESIRHLPRSLRILMYTCGFPSDLL